MSPMSLLALVLYGAIMLACLAARAAATTQPDRRGDIVHWAALAAALAGLAALRIGEVEQRGRDFIRDWAFSSGAYDARTGLQIVLIGLIALGGLAMAALFFRQWRRARPGSRARLVLLSLYALLGFLPLFALRMVSLHQVDMVLYSGPLRLNWVAEGVLLLIVGACAVIYARRKRSRSVRR